MANGINTISLKKHALDKNVLDRPDVLNLVDSEKSKRDELYGPLPPSKHIPHDHDGDGIPDH